MKGPIPENVNYSPPTSQETRANAIFSIDGEVYPAQDIEGTVLKEILPIYY
jgi:hypothetical protein